MKQEDKELLLRDLCCRLPYGVKGKTLGSKTCTLSFIGNDGSVTANTFHCWLGSKQFVPYLRPMSSMTEEEINEFILISDTVLWIGNKRSTCILSLEQMDWLNAHHFDYRGLIEKGLALEAPEGMYK